MRSSYRRTKGNLVASALAGAWRATPSSELDITESQLDEITPLFCSSGGAGLGWWRVRTTRLSETPSGQVLRQAYRLQTLQSAIHEEEIQKVFRLLREAGVEPILAKGWAAANFYPDQALRAYGDIDLLVSDDQFARAENVLQSEEASDCWVDLHRSFAELPDRKVEKLFERSTLLDLNGHQIRVLSDEDHLALLAIHLLKHGAWRPLWLCDIGAVVESIPSTFDWSICLGPNQKKATWILVAVRLAGSLLNAKTEHLALSREKAELPQWLIASVLRQWDKPVAGDRPPMSHPRPMSSFLKSPRGLWEGLQQRWPDPILATVSVNGSFSEIPRLPYQVGNCLLRTGQFLKDLRWRLQNS